MLPGAPPIKLDPAGEVRLPDGGGDGGVLVVAGQGGALPKAKAFQPFPPSNSPYMYFLLYFTTSLQKIPPPITPLQPFPISISSIYYHSLTNYLFNIFEFKKKSYSIYTIIIRIIIMLQGSNMINIAKKRCD